MTELDLGWQDVLRRAQRRSARRYVIAVILAAALIGGGSALGIALTSQSAAAVKLPMNKIGGSTIVTVIDPHTRKTVIVAGRWRRRDGVCFLVPHVRAGCLRHGQRTPLITPPPVLLRRLGRNALVIVVARSHGVIEIVDAKTGRVLERVKVGR